MTRPGESPGVPAEADFEAAAQRLAGLHLALGRVIVGQDALIQGLICAVVAGGHVLLEGLPGLGKTHLVKALASALGLSLARVQCTPDLMPADITGSEVLVPQSGGGQTWDRPGAPRVPAVPGCGTLGFRPGPIFAHLVLVDEVNRATPKTQSALLEAMQEGQVTQAGARHALPNPFWVVATQNPIEIEGTYSLPEAQLDRFLVQLQVEIPDAAGLLTMLEVSLDDEPADHLVAVLDLAAVTRLMGLARAVVIAPPLKRAAVDLVLATHPERARSGPAARLRYGASPRALQALLRTARVRALIAGRAHLTPADLDAVALPCLRHRILLGIDAELAGERADTLLGEILAGWRRGLA
jgi:MoxR-like ATPase